MSNNKIFKLLIPDTKIYLWIIGILIGIIAIYKPIIAVFGAMVLSYLVYYHWKNVHLRKMAWIKYIEGFTQEFDSATKYAILNLPIPLVTIEVDGTISWYNSKFIEIMNNQEILAKNISEIIPNFNVDDVVNEKQTTSIEVMFNNKNYKVLYNIVKKDDSDDYIMMLYWIDITNFNGLKEIYNDEKINICSIQVDNFEEVLKNTDEAKKPIVLAEIDKRLNVWTSRMNSFIIKYKSDRYIVVFENRYLENLEARKFDILDDIRDIDEGNNIPVTLSVGVGVYGKNPSQAYDFAESAMDIALGRGGDQVVVKKIDKLSFYGGKSKAVEKRTKVKARVIAHALKRFIEQSENVFIMGHKIGDMDSFGASIGIYSVVKSCGKEGYIVLNESNPSIDNLMERVKEEHPEYLDYIITTEEALSKVNESSLCIVLDNHRPNFTEAPELLEVVDKVILIDHHRRGAEFIEDPVLVFLEPYASSTCELVTEILFYLGNKVSIEKFEAEALLSGIAVDTKNFTFKTGVRTFEAASFLRRLGADTTSVKRLFKDDLASFIRKAEVIKTAEIIEEDIAISTLDEEVEDSILIAAQAADELLNIKGISASFVLALSDEKIHISGRSLGDISVQLILEKLGGGGHLTTAGARLENVNLENAKKLLKNAIRQYIEEGEK